MAKTYGIASGLVGFTVSAGGLERFTTLRVSIDRVEGRYAWVTTADIRDAGTRLVLDASQITEIPAAEDAVWHKAGLVPLAG